ncbi:SIS domain-containing protein [bacterium]|nr:SIS domain-containing protein [bacterium]
MAPRVAVDPESVVRSRLQESARTLTKLLETEMASIVAAGRLLADAIKGGRKVLFCGNGGSAADCQHIATELVVRLTPVFVRPALAAVALTTDSSLLTACANDFGFEHVFERQVEALGQKGDALVAITTSGKSRNVVLALEKARSLSLGTVLLSAGTGGDCARLADVRVLVPHTETGHIQECHIAIGHVLAELIERLACGRE